MKMTEYSSYITILLDIVCSTPKIPYVTIFTDKLSSPFFKLF
jgi:hypothetical protein